MPSLIPNAPPLLLLMASSNSPPSAAAASGGGRGGDLDRSPSPLPLPAAPPPSSSSRRLPPPCWTNDETLALIESYRDKWLALRRGNLRAADWQDVADAVVARSRLAPGASPKTAVQCRHKVEKLRKRYRAERQRSLAADPDAPPSSSWLFFPHLHSMDLAPSSASAPAAAQSSPSSSDDDDRRPRAGNTRSIHRLLDNGGAAAGGGLKFKIPKAVRSKIVGSRSEERHTPFQNPTFSSGFRARFLGGFGRVSPAAEETRRRMERKRRSKDREEGDAMGEVVSALRMLGEKFMRMEQMKMEQSREMERARMEMELKRTEMVLDSQRKIVDAFVKGLLRRKKRAKVSPDL